MTPLETVAGRINDHLQRNPAKAKSINAWIQFELTDDKGENSDHWLLDLKAPPGQVLHKKHDKPESTVIMSVTNFIKMVNGQLDAQYAFLLGQLKIKGDVSNVIKLGKMF